MDEKEKKGKKPKKEKGEKKPGGSKKILIIILAVILAGGGVAAYIFLVPKTEKPIVYSYFATGDPYYANLPDSSRIMRASVTLVLNTEDTKLQENLTAKNAVIRDTIIFLLRDLSVDDALEEGTQENLRKKIVEQLNKSLEIDNIVGVLFTDFVLS